MKRSFNERLIAVLAALLTAGGVTMSSAAATAWYGGGTHDGYRTVRSSGAPGYPQVHNAAGATNVTDENAWLNGMLVYTGSAPAQVWVYWATADGGTNIASWVGAPNAGSHDFGGTAEFVPLSHEITVVGGTYYYRFYASNSADQSG